MELTFLYILSLDNKTQPILTQFDSINLALIQQEDLYKLFNVPHTWLFAKL